MQASLEDRFPKELALLSRLFGVSYVTARLHRLNAVSEYTEQKWLEYVEGIRGKPVNYLLIAEAPPETADNPPLYFLDPVCSPRTLMRAVSSAFFGRKSTDGAATLASLAGRGFLMVDSIPFAMKYTSSRRSSLAYSRLVAMAARTYMQTKLALASLSWSDDLRIAFSVRLNARCVMAALQHALQLGEREFCLSDDMIATDRSNYPCGNILREVFRLKGQQPP